MEVEERKGERVLIDRTTLREKLMEWSARCHAVGRCFREARDRLEDGGLPCVIWAERGAEGLRLLYTRWQKLLDVMWAEEPGGAVRGKLKLTYNSHTGKLNPPLTQGNWEIYA